MILIKNGRYEEAESLIRRALAIDYKVLGPEHPNVAKDLDHLADVVKYNHERSDVESPSKRAPQGYSAPLSIGGESLLAKIIGILIFIVITLVILVIVLLIIWGIYSIIF